MSISATTISEPKTVLELTQPPAFCKAIYFYYTCGCRTPEPIFCCRPCADDSSEFTSNPCRHETPSVVIAKLPHACKSGKTEACTSVDPALLEFVREVDTAEHLDLATLHDIPRDEINTAIPERVDGDFTMTKIALRYLVRRRNPPAFSPTVVPFIPRIYAETSSRIPTSDVKALSDAVGDTPVDSIKESIDNVECDGEGQQNGESENWRNSCDQRVCEVLTRRSYSNSEGSEKIFVVPLTATENAVSESRAEHTSEPEKPDSKASATGYDDMMMFSRTLDDNETARRIEASCWSVLSLFGKSLMAASKNRGS